MEKNKITELVGKLGSDSKSESGKAAQTLVEMAEPVFKKWFAVVNKYDGNANISDDGEYLPSRGDIDGVSYSKARKVLVFSYSDGCMGEHIEDFICVKPDDLADPNFLKRVERECWEKAVAREKAELEKLKNKLEKHERNLSELESNEPEK